jgi:ribose 5-phosphate isomerase B
MTTELATTPPKPIAIGSDDAGCGLKAAIAAHLVARGIAIKDFGVPDAADKSPYPDVALAVAQSISAGAQDRGILICGTGIGVCITANKIPGIRAAVCHDSYSAQRARKSNDCQIMTLGARVIGLELAKNLVDIWLDSEFETRSAPKIARLSEIEKQFHT